MMRSLVIRSLVALLPLVPTGCALGPDAVRPNITAPAAWKEAPAAASLTETETHPIPFAWWRIFGDPQLNALEAQVLASNEDLQRALARVTEARALARLSAADLMPGVSAGSSAMRQRMSENQPGYIAAERENTTFRAGFDLSYEIDLWRRNRHAADAARWEAFAGESDFQSVLLTLTADAARHYHELQALDAELRAMEATRGLRRDALALQTTRYDAGLINEVDVTRARTELANVDAEIQGVVRQRAGFEHALAVLCGEAPGGFSIASHVHEFAPPTIPVGLPAELLQRRPDIAAAEQHFEAARARIAVAKADFFPRISLTGSAGFASDELSQLARGGSQTWSFGPSIHLPLFDGGRNRANLSVAEARSEQAAASYRGVVLNAFREVEDALSELRTLALQRDAVRRGLGAARETAALAGERYQRGLSNYLEVVDAQRGVFRAERDDAQLRGQQAVSTIRLAKALGGGWRSQEDQVASQ